MGVENAIAASAIALIGDPARHTTVASAVDNAGRPCAGATDAAVAWSVLGAVNRIAVLEHTSEIEGWRSLTRALVAAGLTHRTPHAEAVAELARFSEPRSEPS